MGVPADAEGTFCPMPDLVPAANNGRSTGIVPRWGPGQSGHPSGRRKSFVHLVREQTQDGAELVAIALEIVRARRKPVKYRLQALEWLADRGWGKVTQEHQLTGADGAPIVFTLVLGERQEPTA